MKIAIIANNEKKELMVQLCIAYCGILSKHHICSTAATGNVIHEATGLEVEKMLTGVSGGIEQVASRISCNEVDILLFFRSNNPMFFSSFILSMISLISFLSFSEMSSKLSITFFEIFLVSRSISK